MSTGISIPIEERNGDEVRNFRGKTAAPENILVFNPGFDVTPHELIAGIITEYGVLSEPYDEMIIQLARKIRRNFNG